MLISDFGLCKKLDVDQTSFLPTSHGAMAAGTVGWRAPEILRGDVKLDEMGAGDDASVSSQGSAALGASNGSAGKPARLTKSVDIFALGCLLFYTLTSGGHPFGDRFEREVNIMKGAKNLQGLERFGEEGEEAVDLISAMLHAEAHERPDTTTYASDRFEIMTQIPKELYLLVLERGASGIVGNDWLSRLDPLFLENLGKFRKYDGRSVQDLLRALGNKKHHYQDLPDKVKRNLGLMPEGFLAYFTQRFPRLFLHVHSVVGDTSLRTESMFGSYFELHDR
ncbi:ribonuclease 2-5A-domain-containing protein, partial [Mycena olivaceomarginata]